MIMGSEAEPFGGKTAVLQVKSEKADLFLQLAKTALKGLDEAKKDAADAPEVAKDAENATEDALEVAKDAEAEEDYPQDL